MAAKIAKVPLWAFHGTIDPAVPVSGSRDMIAAMRAAGGHPLYTEYPNGMHDIWFMAYNTPELLPWMNSQRLGMEDNSTDAGVPLPRDASVSGNDAGVDATASTGTGGAGGSSGAGGAASGSAGAGGSSGAGGGAGAGGSSSGGASGAAGTGTVTGTAGATGTGGGTSAAGTSGAAGSSSGVGHASKGGGCAVGGDGTSVVGLWLLAALAAAAARRRRA
jgi:MYXO-CTERM domain-containing protein